MDVIKKAGYRFGSETHILVDFDNFHRFARFGDYSRGYVREPDGSGYALTGLHRDRMIPFSCKLRDAGCGSKRII